MGDGRIFLKTRRDASFNKNLSNEPPSRWTFKLDKKSHPLFQSWGSGSPFLLRCLGIVIIAVYSDISAYFLGEITN